MARKERLMVTITDDLTGEEQKEGAGSTVEFMWEGKLRQIDLSDENAQKFNKMMEPYVEHSRRVRNSPAATPSASPHTGGDGRRRGGGRGMGRSTEEIAAIRSWARANGHTVADSGLIPRKIVEAWEKRELIPTIPGSAPTPPTSQAAPSRAAGKAPGAAPAKDTVKPVPSPAFAAPPR